MVAKFDTGGAGATQTKGGDYTLLWIGVILVAGYLGWRYVVKPYLDKQKEEANKVVHEEAKV